MKTKQPGIQDVKDFWENHPLCQFESPYAVGTREFFDWHHNVRSSDEFFALHLYEFAQHNGQRVLDVGCGIGWITHNFATNAADIVGVDITYRAASTTKNRLALYGESGITLQANAEILPFCDGAFSFAVSAGVLHHTPDTAQGIQEILRVLKPGGGAMISLYYKSWLLSDRVWWLVRPILRGLFSRIAGRSQFTKVESQNDLVRMYDGNDNPIGKAYSRDELCTLLNGLIIESISVHYFPMRFLPMSGVLPHFIKRMIDRAFGLMIYVVVNKPENNA